MTITRDDILNPGATERDPNFPHAPADWNRAAAEAVASAEGLTLSDDHWVVIRAVQDYFARTDQPNLRELQDGLDERFHAQGGLKHLYRLLPGGPIAQGCRLAGLAPPAGAIDESFGAVR
ncbi:TusE/DsrC/DsvC family sulfur relay protein [Thiococcus pfennigii]|jgi:tRNA 2-thiouridine synthesizing protein E|uniref:TusE/DsrC/DsvC family sulfur relay protein n=1 Tax=Thiococcus pfennigii TaxID=1057 RepID=UPI001904C1D5|nr:TusE/DsrC/DsvC family sulfur relay protein [Thiococcus pfennigii]MBK1699857.1 sulfite reductase [Thiococcus pfennigii]MBK1733601.1 sulfite reductase [Thiococcus pfennigii]